MIQHYVIKFVSDLQQVGSFSLVFPTDKSDRHGIAEIWLKVALNTKTLTPCSVAYAWIVILCNMYYSLKIAGYISRLTIRNFRFGNNIPK